MGFKARFIRDVAAGEECFVDYGYSDKWLACVPVQDEAALELRKAKGRGKDKGKDKEDQDKDNSAGKDKEDKDKDQGSVDITTTHKDKEDSLNPAGVGDHSAGGPSSQVPSAPTGN